MSKTMTATTGNSSVWNVTKDSLPTDVNFDTCAGGAMAQAREVTITIRWTKVATSNGRPSASARAAARPTTAWWPR